MPKNHVVIPPSKNPGLAVKDKPVPVNTRPIDLHSRPRPSLEWAGRGPQTQPVDTARFLHDKPKNDPSANGPNRGGVGY